MNTRLPPLRLLAPVTLCALALLACGFFPSGNQNQPTPAATLQAQAATLPVEVATQGPAPATEAPTTAPTAEPPTLAPAMPTAELAPLEYAVGRNDYVIELEDVPRKFLVYVPDGYDPARPVPVVFMFHGSNQGGQYMYEHTGWAAKADQEDFIVVFPTSWKYFLTTENRVSDKWNVVALHKQVEPGTELKDDVGFVRVMLELLKLTFNVDETRLYATGFSNGGGFVLTRLMIEMNDVFAAFTTSGSGLWGEDQLDNLPTHINASLYSVVGSNDAKIAAGTGYPLPFPILPEEIVADPGMAAMLGNTTTVLSLDPAVYEAQSERPWFTTLIYQTSLAGADNQYIFRMVNNMGHVYPSGDNNRAELNVADLFWDFFLLYSKP